MSTIQLHHELTKLSLSEKRSLSAWLLREVQQTSQTEVSLAAAAARMLADYSNDAELTAFTT
ncbi:MAG: hypothetical protein ACOVSW_02365 [Candidatus Kapaibacteriota bacterium]|jgi:hypothetical protein